jgi:hypothetical protein
MGYYEGEIGSLCGNNNNNGFGSNGWGDLAALIVVAGLFGWGNGGFGIGGGAGRGGAYATQADISAGFANSEIMSDLNDIILNQSQGFAAVQQTLCQGFSGVNSTVTNGFTNLNTNLASMAYNTQAGFNSVSRELAECCCANARNIDSLRYDMAKGFCDVVRSGQDNTRAILDYLSGEKIASLQAENAGLKAQISNDKQSAYLISQLREPCPIPAYITPNPNCCYNYGVYPVNNGFCGASVQ